MIEADWQVWPVFVVQLIAFLVLFFPSKWRFLKLGLQAWVLIILLGADLGISISLLHDSFDPIGLYF